MYFWFSFSDFQYMTHYLFWARLCHFLSYHYSRAEFYCMIQPVWLTVFNSSNAKNSLSLSKASILAFFQYSPTYLNKPDLLYYPPLHRLSRFPLYPTNLGSLVLFVSQLLLYHHSNSYSLDSGSFLNSSLFLVFFRYVSDFQGIQYL